LLAGLWEAVLRGEEIAPVALPLKAARCYFPTMSTLAEIEKAVPQFSAEELAELEQFVHKARLDKERAQRKPSLRDIKPVSVGRIRQPLGTRDDWYDEMLENRV
jgi:hypothetical protein